MINIEVKGIESVLVDNTFKPYRLEEGDLIVGFFTNSQTNTYIARYKYRRKKGTTAMIYTCRLLYHHRRKDDADIGLYEWEIIGKVVEEYKVAKEIIMERL